MKNPIKKTDIKIQHPKEKEKPKTEDVKKSKPVESQKPTSEEPGQSTNKNHSTKTDQSPKIDQSKKVDQIKEIIIIPSSQQTKKWRNDCDWYRGGKHTECEKYQINTIKEKLKISQWEKTNMRLNISTFELKNNSKPLVNNDGFEWTENFDGLLNKNSNQYYFNLKFVCDSGGAQNRSLREVYHFIKCQLEHLKKFKSKNIYFINILDGDTSHSFKDKYKYLREKEEYKDFIKYLYIGDLFDFTNEVVLKFYSLN
jgi:hypothetical protein